MGGYCIAVTLDFTKLRLFGKSNKCKCRVFQKGEVQCSRFFKNRSSLRSNLGYLLYYLIIFNNLNRRGWPGTVKANNNMPHELIKSQKATNNSTFSLYSSSYFDNLPYSIKTTNPHI